MIIITFWGAKYIKKVEEGKFAPALFNLGPPSSPVLGNWHFYFLALWTKIRIYAIASFPLLYTPTYIPSFSGRWTWIGSYTTSSSRCQAFELRLNYSTSFPIYSLEVEKNIYIYVYRHRYRYRYKISYWFSFSGKPRLIYLLKDHRSLWRRLRE